MENKKTPGATIAASNQAPTTSNVSITQSRTEYYKTSDIDNENFLMLPKLLFSNPYYENLSITAKVIYALLKDRMHLSRENGWHEEDGTIFLLFKQSEICEALHISNKTCVKNMQELVKYDLIEIVRQGLGRANKIHILKCRKYTREECRSVESTRLKCKNYTTEVKNLHTNNTEKSNTKSSNTESKRAAAAEAAHDNELLYTSEDDKTKHDIALVMNAFQNNIHAISSAVEKDMLIDLVNTYSTTWVLEAIKEAAKSSGKTVKYIESILKRWSTLNSNQPWLIKKTQTQYNKQYNKAEATRQAAKNAVTELLEEFRREDETEAQ